MKKKCINYFLKTSIYKIGYRYFNLKRRSKKDIYVIKAFQRQIFAKNVSGVIDKKTI